MKTTRTLSIICGLLFAVPALALGQTTGNARYKISSGSKVWFDATSTLHGFSATSDSARGTITIEENSTAGETASKSATVLGADVSIPVVTLKSGENGLDKNMYKAMNVEKFPDIRFNMISAVVNDSADTVKDGIPLKTTGSLTIAGETRNIVMNAVLHNSPAGGMVLTGTKPIVMSNFGIKPPTMMFGVIKVGDKVKVHFSLRLKQAVTNALSER